ncbi:MAG: NAD(P)/FAD-dependent oxidoreductase [Phycisphaeraceae bacterium]|nr:NAD(P)/FAD-dependent oxidoreductase [Phycisphaeraceae bacterium]
MTDRADIVIVGAGAAGLAAAIFAREAAPQKRVLLLDGAKKIGAKILVSGGGRCNVTHERIRAADYFGNPRLVRNVLAAFTVKQTVQWFESLGVQLKREDTGKLFPVTDSARTVLDALLRRCEQLGVNILTDSRVTDIAHHDNVFTLRRGLSEAKPRIPPITCNRLILATGGRSLPRSGSDGFGYQLAQQFGHSIMPTHPALAPLVLDESFFHKSLAGIAMDVRLTTFVDGRKADQRQGAMLWTHFGVSGPVVMDASRVWIIAHAEGKRAEIQCQLLPAETFDSLEDHFVRRATEHPKRTAARALAELMPQRVADAVRESVGIRPWETCGQLPRTARRALIHAVTELHLPVLRDRGWNEAEVTAGGVPLEEIDTATMQSRCCPGLHLVGEILDADGRIGGFNFQWAWCTGRIAGLAAGTAPGQ